MSVIKPKSKLGPFLFFFILIVFVAGAIFYTSGDTGLLEHNAVTDIDSLIYGFQALANGDIDGFVDGLFGGLLVIALFMVVFAIMHFLFTHALKKVFPRKSHATILALVVTIYAFVDQRIYNYMLSLNAFAIGFLVFCAAIIMIWGFTDHAAKNFEKDWAEAQKVKKGYAPDKKSINDLRHLLAKQRSDEKKRRNS